MQTGNLIVTGENFSTILLRGKPREVFVHFKHEHNPTPCNPHHHDFLEHEILHEDERLEEHQKLEHHHHNRQFFLLIKWRVDGLREIDWLVIY